MRVRMLRDRTVWNPAGIFCVSCKDPAVSVNCWEIYDELDLRFLLEKWGKGYVEWIGLHHD